MLERCLLLFQAPVFFALALRCRDFLDLRLEGGVALQVDSAVLAEGVGIVSRLFIDESAEPRFFQNMIKLSRQTR